MTWRAQQPIAQANGMPTPEFVMFINGLSHFVRVDSAADIPAEAPVGTFFYVITSGTVTAIYAGSAPIWP